MGSVAMGKGGSFRFEGSTITAIIYCMYCDKCGSFDISKRTPLKVLIGVCVCIAIAAVCSPSPDLSARVACIAPLALVIIGALQMVDIPQCRKCGNRHFTRGNGLNYPEDDQSILDVPFNQTIKYAMDDY
jgi:hypothetical protein